MGKGIWGQLTSRVPAPKPGTLLWRPWHLITSLNTTLYRLSGGRLFGSFDGAPVLILHHRGAKSGQPRETPLVYAPDGTRLLLIASIGGNPKNPAWFHNLKAHPDVTVEVGRSKRQVRARVADAEEREALWPKVVAVWPAYEDYQRRTTRTIPIVVLEPRAEA